MDNDWPKGESLASIVSAYAAYCYGLYPHDSRINIFTATAKASCRGLYRDRVKDRG